MHEINGWRVKPINISGIDEHQETSPPFRQPRYRGNESFSGILLQPQKDRQSDQRESEQEAHEPQVVTQRAKYLGTEGYRVVLGIESSARLGAEDELDDGASFPPSFVGKLIVGLDRRQHDGANDERNEQACDTLADIATRCASPQREPTGRPGHQEEKRHPPEIEKTGIKRLPGRFFPRS